VSSTDIVEPRAGSGGASAQPALGRSRGRRIGDPAFRILVTGLAAATLAILALLIVTTTRTAWPVLSTDPVGFVTGRAWAPGLGRYGALPFISGTVASSLLAVLFAVPVSIAIAVYLVEIAPRGVRRPLTYAVDLLAAVPSVVYGLWGFLVMIPFLVKHVYPFLSNRLSFLPLFDHAVGSGRNVLSAGLVLALMIVPIITAVSREAISLVPRGQMDAALGLGATRGEAIRTAVLPYARSGIIGGVVLGLGRAMGETIAVLLTIGSGTKVVDSLLSQGQSMAGAIASQFGEASGTRKDALIAIGVLLFAITICVNLVAQIFVRRAARGHA
jgi:phosphate transport system permease protein